MKGQSRHRPHWTMWLVYALIVAALVSTTTLSRYMTTISGAGSATVAAMDMHGSDITFAVTDLKPGGSVDYRFAVVNFTGDRTSDVAQSYSITVNDEGNLPLTYTLRCTDTGGNGSGIHTGEAAALQKNTAAQGGLLPCTAKTTHKYTLTVNWTGGQNNASYADEIDLLTVTVNAEQTTP